MSVNWIYWYWYEEKYKKMVIFGKNILDFGSQWKNIGENGSRLCCVSPNSFHQLLPLDFSYNARNVNFSA